MTGDTVKEMEDVSTRVKVISSILVTLLIIVMGVLIGRMIYKDNYEYVCAYKTNIGNRVGIARIYLKSEGNDIEFKNVITIQPNRNELLSQSDISNIINIANSSFKEYRNLQLGYSNKKVVVNYSGTIKGISSKQYKENLEVDGAKCT